MARLYRVQGQPTISKAHAIQFMRFVTGTRTLWRFRVTPSRTDRFGNLAPQLFSTLIPISHLPGLSRARLQSPGLIAASATLRLEAMMVLTLLWGLLLAYALAATVNLALFGACQLAFSQLGNPPWASRVFDAAVFGSLLGPLLAMFVVYQDRKSPRKPVFVRRVPIGAAGAKAAAVSPKNPNSLASRLFGLVCVIAGLRGWSVGRRLQAACSASPLSS
jgi:hypothetical protein